MKMICFNYKSSTVSLAAPTSLRAPSSSVSGCVAAAALNERRDGRSVGRRSVDSRGNASVDDKQYITIDLVRIVNTTHS